MNNNFYPSSEKYNRYNNNFMLLKNFYDSQKKNISNNYVIDHPKRLYNEYNDIQLINIENQNIPTPKKVNLLIEEDKNDKNEINNNTKKFFTDYGGFGYKCSCSKTNCNRS